MRAAFSEGALDADQPVGRGFARAGAGGDGTGNQYSAGRRHALRWGWDRQKPALEALLALGHQSAQPDRAFADTGIDAWRALDATLEEPLFSFLHPEPLRLLGELDWDATPHQRREEIGLRLGQMGDRRHGVGLDANGCPDIATVFGCVVRPPSNSRFAALLIARHLAVASFGPRRVL